MSTVSMLPVMSFKSTIHGSFLMCFEHVISFQHLHINNLMSVSFREIDRYSPVSV